MFAKSQADELFIGITVREIESLCHQAAASVLVKADGYQPTANQVFFFTLVWVSKVMVKQQEIIDFRHKDWVIRCVDSAGVQQRARLVAQFLREWGAAVSGLKQSDDKRWELLRIQMEKALKRFDCPVETKDDAVQEAFFKMHQMLAKMPDSLLLEATTDLAALVAQNQTIFKGIYDFGAPIYAYAQRVVHNHLINLLKDSADEPVDEDGWEQAEVITVDDEEPSTEEVDRYPQILKKSLKRLFFLLETKLTPMPAKVIWHTLAARSQFWLALSITAVKPPSPLPPMPAASDADIARTLTISENDVRVHRNHAKKTIHNSDPKAGKLLEVLLDRHLSKQLNIWPPI
jgi:DNA-directed RNA polymerase specialized sigma24 family protein